MSFEEQLAVAKAEARGRFQQQLRGGYRGFAQGYAQRTGRYPHPAVVERWRRGETQEFEARLREWETGAKEEYEVKSAEALEEWRTGIKERYPSDRYIIEWTTEGARITEKIPPQVERGFYKAQQVEVKQYREFMQELPYEVPFFVERGLTKAQQDEIRQFNQFVGFQQIQPPASIERGFYKTQRVEAAQMLEQMQIPGYEPKKVGAFYKAEKGKRRGAEVYPIELAREYAYYHPEKVLYPKSLAETLLEIGVTEPLPQIRRAGFGKQKLVIEPVKPLAGIAGFVAYPETLLYAGMTWIGVEPLTRPPPPLKEGGQEYKLGYVTGMVVGSVLLTEAIAKTPIPKWEAKIWEKVVGKKAAVWLTKQYLEKGPVDWKGLSERIVMELTGAKPYLAPQVVSVPTPEVLSYPALEAQATAWGLAETPKTSALIISKMPGEVLAKAWVREHLFKVATGGLSYALVEEQLRKTLEPQMPYIPRDIYGPETSRIVIPMLLPTVTPKPTVAPKPLATTMPTEIVKPKVAEILSIVQIPKASQVSKVVPTLSSVALEKQVLQQIQMPQQVQVQRVTLQQIQQTMLEPPRTIPKVLDISKPKKHKRRKKGRSPFKLYEEFVYPIATPKQFMQKVVK